MSAEVNKKFDSLIKEIIRESNLPCLDMQDAKQVIKYNRAIKKLRLIKKGVQII